MSAISSRLVLTQNNRKRVKSRIYLQELGQGFEPITRIDVKTRFQTNAKTYTNCNRSLESLFKAMIQF